MKKLEFRNIDVEENLRDIGIREQDHGIVDDVIYVVGDCRKTPAY